MTPYFKKYLKDAMAESLKGAITGAICGSIAGVSSLNHVMVSQDSCLNSGFKTADQFSLGALAGMEVGAVVGLVAFPAYNMFMGWLCPRICRTNPQNQVNLDNYVADAEDAFSNRV